MKISFSAGAYPIVLSGRSAVWLLPIAGHDAHGCSQLTTAVGSSFMFSAVQENVLACRILGAASSPSLQYDEPLGAPERWSDDRLAALDKSIHRPVTVDVRRILIGRRTAT